MKLSLEDDGMCYVCGKNNKDGFRLDFEHPRSGVLRAEVVFEKRHQGYKGIVHGGLVATLLDEMMINLAWKEGFPAVTAELNVRLKKATLVGDKVRLEGRLEPSKARKGRLIKAKAEAWNQKGELLAWATATCVRLGIKKALH